MCTGTCTREGVRVAGRRAGAGTENGKEGKDGMNGIRKGIFCVCAVLAMGTAPLAGQVSEEAQLREMIEVYVRGEVLLGRIPDGSPLAGAIPSDARIIGSVERALGGANTTVLLGMSGGEAAVVQRLRGALTEAGWTSLERQLPERGGFTMVHMGSQYSVFCGEDGHVMLTTSEGQPGEVRVQLTHTRAGEGSPCELPRADRAMDSPLPALSGPQGSRMHGGGMSSSGNRHFSSSASFDTTLPVSELTAHFAAQIESQGWRQTSTQGDGDVAVRTFSRTDERARRLHGTLLIVAPPGSTTREALFSIVLLAGASR